MKTIKFSKDYPKLEDRVFTTIRRYDRYNIDEIILVKTPSKNFEAVILHKFKEALGQLGSKFLCYDTGTNSIIEVMKVFNSFYRKHLTPSEIVTILIIRRLET